MDSRPESSIAIYHQNIERSRCNSERPSTLLRKNLLQPHEEAPSNQTLEEKKPPIIPQRRLKREGPGGPEEEKVQVQPL
jgi:hypothetical protein